MRIPSLDGIRGIAILLVLLVHTRIARAPENFAEAAASGVIGASWVGVDLFFVLSGFLITGILLDSRPKADYYRTFYIRRTLRIFPLYYAALTVFLVLALAAPGLPKMTWYRDHFLWFGLYIANFATVWAGGSCGVFSHFWSLCVEEQFYLCWPAVVRLCRLSLFPAVCLGLVAASVLTRGVLHWQGWDVMTIYTFTPARLDGLAMGALGAYCVRRWSPRMGLGFGIAGVAGAAAALAIAWREGSFYYGSPLASTLGIAAFSAAAAALVVASVRLPATSRLNRILSWRVLRWFGAYSYSLYVFHMPISGVCGRVVLPRLQALPGGWWVQQAAFTATVTAAAALVAMTTWHGLEKRALALRDRWGAPAARQPGKPVLRRAA